MKLKDMVHHWNFINEFDSLTYHVASEKRPGRISKLRGQRLFNDVNIVSQKGDVNGSSLQNRTKKQ